jgi:thiamine biosynthesis lipoprotein
MRRVEQIMGLPISIDIPSYNRKPAFESAFTRFKEIDRRFSTYKSYSEVSKFRRGELTETELSPELKSVIKQCRVWQKKTDGYFSAWAGGDFDPSGYVKGWAIAEAGKEIEKAGKGTYCIGAGGDILARSAGAKVWAIGVQDPTSVNKILNKLSISNGAVATSGNYERGTHIINPITKQPATALKSVTITGPNIITADMLATAVFAAGLEPGRRILKRFANYEAIILA